MGLSSIQDVVRGVEQIFNKNIIVIYSLLLKAKCNCMLLTNEALLPYISLYSPKNIIGVQSFFFTIQGDRKTVIKSICPLCTDDIFQIRIYDYF